MGHWMGQLAEPIHNQPLCDPRRWAAHEEDRPSFEKLGVEGLGLFAFNPKKIMVEAIPTKSHRPPTALPRRKSKLAPSASIATPTRPLMISDQLIARFPKVNSAPDRVNGRSHGRFLRGHLYQEAAPTVANVAQASLQAV
jgi:hypothetical protein